MKALLIAALLAAASLSAAAAPPSSAREVFAIVVTNNHSNQLGRPDLRYADDDGAKYYEVFRLLAPAANVHLLSELDRDTLGLFPHLQAVARPPTQKEVFGAAAAVAKQARAALDAGKTVEVYFVFAGHGDVEKGAGFLELADGALTADQLDKHVLSGIPATRTHVILDSCNSFFVINARKPGGRRFATPNDLTEAFAKKLPHVGVFLSTSAEQEVYEWSELQSGIFSHAVRSGLLGAADVDNDGTVSYKELQAFVTIAAAKVKNPLYRPNVFARGPAGKNDAALVDLTHVDAVSVSVGPEQTRLTVRDKDALPWIDAHVEKGAKVQLRIPSRAADGGAIEVLGPGVERNVTARWALPSTAAPVVAMASLPAAEQTSGARGPQTMLHMLFAEPFGPGSYAHVDQYYLPQQVFGVTQDDAERMDLLLGAVADQQRSQRIGTGAAMLTLGVVYGGSYFYIRQSLDTGDRPASNVDSAMLGVTGLLALVGTYELLSQSTGEKIHSNYRRRMALRRGDDGAIVAETEQRLYELAASHARKRKYAELAGWSMVGLSLGLLALSETQNTSNDSFERGERVGIRALSLSTASLGVLCVVMARIMRTPEERIYGLWRDDPAMRRIPRLGVVPLEGGGGMMTLGGRF